MPRWTVIAVLLLLVAPTASRAQSSRIEHAAARLLKSTLTIRVTATKASSRDEAAKAEFRGAPLTFAPLRGEPAPLVADPEFSPADSRPAVPAADARDVAPLDTSADTADEPGGITVCSGVSLGSGLVVTFVRTPATAPGCEFRVTLPDGGQAKAAIRVVDHYSGLVLLELDDRDLPGLALAEELPNVGGTVLTASASGIESPLISRGILSGVDRTIPGANLPPMVQCDLRTTDTSGGAAVTDSRGRLIGILVATPGEQSGWSFAVSFRHIRRLVDARVEGKQIELVRRRPTLGLKLGPGAQDGAVQVEHVEAGGPADRAGIRQGDLVFEAEGRKIRSAYQAVAIILKRLPGEEVALVVGQDAARRNVRVTLGGAPTVLVVPANTTDGTIQIGAQTNARLAGKAGEQRIEIRRGHKIAELSVKAGAAAPEANTAAEANAESTGRPAHSIGNETELLRRQLEAYQDALNALQKDRRAGEQKEQEQQAQLQALRAELAELKKQLEAKAK